MNITRQKIDPGEYKIVRWPVSEEKYSLEGVGICIMFYSFEIQDSKVGPMMSLFDRGGWPIASVVCGKVVAYE